MPQSFLKGRLSLIIATVFHLEKLSIKTHVGAISWFGILLFGPKATKLVFIYFTAGWFQVPGTVIHDTSFPYREIQTLPYLRRPEAG